MARRSDHTRDELKELMIKSAREIILEKGLMGLTAREVASKIGYSAGTIYNVFSNLDEIVFHLEVEALEILENVLCDIPENAEPSEQLQAFTSQYLLFIEKHFMFWQLLIEHKAPHDMQLPGWYKEKFDQIIALVEERVRPFHSADDVEGVRRSARVFWAGLHGIILLSGTDKLAIVSRNDRREYAEFWVTTYIAGLNANNKTVVSGDKVQEKQPASGQ